MELSKLEKYFNSYTDTGRANVAKATYGTFLLIFLYFRLKRKLTENKVKGLKECESVKPTPKK